MGQGPGGNGGATEGTGAAVGRGGTLGFGGTTPAGGGATGSGGANRTGGVGGVGGTLGTGGMVSVGGTPVSGGAGGAAGTTGSSPAFGMACTTNDDCPSGSTCCDGSNESCDGTRLPTGDGTNPGEFVVSSDGLTVTDTITGLVWQRGGADTRAACTTDPLTCTQAQAEAYCAGLTLGSFSDWRLPATHEVETIVDLAQSAPATDRTAFSDTISSYYWTSSPYALSSGSAWELDFASGYSYSDAVGTLNSVRCVRGARCYPTSRFVVSSGLVTDTLTGLVWQQQASAATMTVADAQSYCSAAGSGFRLPALKELESLVDLTVTPSPPINQTAFPNTPADAYWTSSPYAGSSGYAWSVSFNVGDSLSYDVGSILRVRCVR